MNSPKLLFWLLMAVTGVGCATAPVVQNRQDAAEHLTAAARGQVSPRPPDYTLRGDQADAMPQGSRCVITTTDADPVRVITATVLKVDGSQVHLRTGVTRTLSREWEREGVSDYLDTAASKMHPKGFVVETRFENLRLPLSEIQHVDVFLNSAQASWKRKEEGWRPANRLPVMANNDDSAEE
ncbi:MAG: hypothetical protein NT069_19400 [Planctomycetota bacterium]|nr:hypothetical protein [Planctomycetota bacterium]